MAYLQNSVESQLPQHVVRDYPLFVEFLKAYYEWMEKNGQPYYGIQKHLDWMNFESSMNDYVSFLRQEYLFNLPSNVAGGLELFLQNSKQFHLTIGTEQSFKFIFKILFGTEAGDVELYFPRKDILKVSDSTWTASQEVMYVTDSGNSSEFLYRVVKQTREIYPGVFRYAYAIVQRVSVRYAGKFKIAELYLTNIQGEFQQGWPITVDGYSEWILPTANMVNITSSGIHYYLDDKVSIGGTTEFHKNIKATELRKVDSQISSVYDNSEITVLLDGVEVLDFDYDGRYITHDDIVIGTVVDITFPSFGGYIIVDGIGSNGEIVSLKVIDSPIGVNTLKPLNIQSMTGSGFNGTITPQLTRKIAGYYADDSGHLDSTKVIQDSNYYQEFSYVIKSSLDVDKYRDIVLKLLHPAGMKMFGKVNIIEIIKLMIRESYEIVTIPTRSVISDISVVKLYTSYLTLDQNKYSIDKREYTINHFKDMKLSDFVENNGYKPLNIQNTFINITTPYDNTMLVAQDWDRYVNVTLPENVRVK